jgi:putative transposase
MHKQSLPHIYPKNAAFFITFRLKNSVPTEILEKLKDDKDFKIKQIKVSTMSEQEKMEAIYSEEKRFVARYDNLLHKLMKDDDDLKNPAIANIVADKMKEYDQKLYNLIAYCIMSNHVHLLFTTDGYDANISSIMQLIKGGSAYLCNKLLNRKGEFWQKESYDHYVRNQREFTNIEHYIIQNPVRAGLLEDWQKWEFTYWVE